MKVGVIVPFFNAYDSIKTLVNSILDNNHGYEYEIYIVDNSTIKEPIPELPNTIWIDCKASIGFAKACNVGAYVSLKRNCDTFIFLNQDTRLLDNAFDVLTRYVLSHKNAIVSPMEVNTDGQISAFYQNYYLSKMNILGVLNDKLQVRNLPGSCFIIKSSDFCILNGFNRSFRMYYEDVDFFNRAYEKGFSLLLDENSRIFHEHSNESVTGQQRTQVEKWKHWGFILNNLYSKGYFAGSIMNLKYATKKIIHVSKSRNPFKTIALIWYMTIHLIKGYIVSFNYDHNTSFEGQAHLLITSIIESPNKYIKN